MTNPTNPFSWQMPTATDLVTDLPADFEIFGQAVATSMADLLGGTTGQVLSKASNTNMDFTWVTTDDANAIQNAIVDAKGDLIAASANDTPARLAVGNNGETLVADSSTSTGLRYTAGNPISNPIINSCFDIWQRGTSFVPSTVATTSYTADRWSMYRNATGSTMSRQTTSDTTNLPFIQYCARISRDSGTTSTEQIVLENPLEIANSIPYAGKTVTFSFYARKGANYSATSSALSVIILAGTGTADRNPIYSGYTGQYAPLNTTVTLTTTWQRFTQTFTFAAADTQFAPYFAFTPTGTAGAADYYEVTGVQVDIGSVALPIRRTGSTLQGELAACQRYYYRNTADATFSALGFGTASSTVDVAGKLTLPVSMRTSPSSVDFSTLRLSDELSGYSVTALTLNSTISNRNTATLNIQVASGLTQFRFYTIQANNSTSGYIGVSAEL
jgi:hypothetical protein